MSSGKAPIIILGMCISGISLFARMLGEIGLFLDWRERLRPFGY